VGPAPPRHHSHTHSLTAPLKKWSEILHFFNGVQILDAVSRPGGTKDEVRRRQSGFRMRIRGEWAVAWLVGVQ
jgi:hypothetical protein